MYRLLWFWTSAALLMSCCGQLDNDTYYLEDYYSSNLTDYIYFNNGTADYDYDDKDGSYLGSGAQKVLGTGQVTLVLLLGLAVPHVLH